MTWIDLCSGLGGFSQPAKDRGWQVITVDINPAFKPNILADLQDLEQVVNLYRYLPQHPTVISASPVCTDFTKAGLPQTWASNRKCPPKPDAKLTAGCYLLIKTLNPDWWTIENVLASRKFLTPILGPVYGRVAGHVFWGKLPCLLPDTLGHKWRLPPSPERAAVRSKIPYEIGEAICRAVEKQARSVVACSHCGKDIVISERTSEGIASEYQDADGRCYTCATGSRLRNRPTPKDQDG